MKVLILTTTFPRWKDDTTPAFIYNLAKELVKRGLEVVVLAPHYKGAKKFEIMDGVKVYRFQYFFPASLQKVAYDGGILANLRRSFLSISQIPLLFLAELIAAIKIIKRERVDIIHSHWIIPSGLIGAICANIFNIPHVTSAHAGDVFSFKDSKLINILRRYVIRTAHLTTANSTYTLKILLGIAENSATKKKLKIIPMGVDTKIFKKTKTVCSFKKKQDFVILSIGRLVEKKGIKYLILAIEKIVHSFPKVKLLIGGSGPERHNLENLVNKLGLDKYVYFLGYVPTKKLPFYYSCSDLFVLPSVHSKEGDTEGLGVVLLESLACGTPILGSNIGGIPDVIIDGVNGFLVEPGNPKDIALKILKIIDNRKLLKKSSKHGTNIITKKFSWSVIAERFSVFYEKTIHGE